MKRFASFTPIVRRYQTFFWIFAAPLGLLAFFITAMNSQTVAASTTITEQTLIPSAQPNLALANANILYVTAAGTGTACSMAQPCYLHTAVEEAANGYEIRVAEGLYDQEQSVVGEVDLPTLYINKSLTIIGGYTTTNWTVSDPVAHPTILDGQNTRRVVWLKSGIGSLQGFTIHNGSTSDNNGAGIFVDENATQLIAYNQIHNNSTSGASTHGGGVDVLGEATLLANQIYDNAAVFGGGVFVVSVGTVNLFDNIIYNNNASSTFGSGGIGFQSTDGTGTLNIWHNTIANNSAPNASSGGGGLALFDGTVTVYNNIIANNTAAGGSSGLYEAGATVTGSHNNLFNNTTNATLTDPITGDPLFVNAAAGNYRLQAGSPNRDVATAVFSSTIDFESQPRPFNSTADVGADEYYPASATCFARLNDGMADGEVFVNLQTAVDQAQPGDLVKVAGYCTDTGAQVVAIDKDITLQGGYQLTNWNTAERGQTATILDGENSRRLVVVTADGPTIDSLHLINGNATTGVAVHVTGGTPLISNNMVYSNTATSGAVIASNAGTTPNVQFNTIVDNSGDGVALAVNGMIQNNIVYNNTGIPTSGGTVTNFNLIGVEPQFVNAAGNDYRLTSTSPALDFGNPNAAVSTDIEGNLRPRGQRPDAGADEANNYPSAIFNPTNSTLELERGTSLNVPLKLINNGTLPDTWDISVEQVQGWALTFLPQATNLAVGAQVDLSVVVTAPLTAVPQTPETLTFTATSQLNPNAQAIATVHLNIIPVRGIDLTPSYPDTQLLPGEVITFEHTIQNLGESTDTFRVQILDDPFGWGTLYTAAFAPETDGMYDVVLNAGATIKTYVRIDVPEFAPAGFANELLLQAYSIAEPAVQDIVTDTVTAKATVGTRYVSTAGNDTDNNCRVNTNPCRTVARGINQASTGDEVHIATGTYQETTEIGINTSIAVSGGWDATFSRQDELFNEQSTIISAEGLDRLFNISGSATNLTMSYLTLSNGNRTSGGAIFLRNNAQANFSNMAFIDNQATRGGAIYLAAGTTTKLTSSRFRNNEAGTDGGAIYSEANLEAFNNLFVGNVAGEEGGALYIVTPAALTFWHNTLHQNQAQTGGALYQASGTAVVRNNNFTKNTAPQSGAIHSAAGTYSADYNNIWQNSLPASNRALGANSTNLDPLYTGALYRLSPISPVIDIGDPNSPVSEDFEGNPRPTDQGFDLGWYELAGCTVRRSGTIYFSIQEAINAGGDSLIQVSGICRGVNTAVVDGKPISQTVFLTEDLTIQGGWNTDFNNDVSKEPLPTFINPQGLGRGIFIGEGASPTIESIAVISGTAVGLGGGPADEDAGGGIYVVSGAPIFSQVGIYSSTATIGGGFYNHDGAPMFTVVGVHNTVLDNTGNVRVSDLAYNQATTGGALYSNNGDLTLSHTFVRWNEATTGAGAYIHANTTLTLTNNVFYQNVATGNGGALHNNAPNPQIWHQTFYQNEATNGGAIYNMGNSATLHNNIFQENAAVNNGPAIFQNATTPNFDYNYYNGHVGAPVSGTTLGANSQNSTTPPGLLDPESGDFHLNATGTVLDIGDPDTPVLVDFEEDVRPSNQGFDIGADELAGCYARVNGVIYGSPQVALQNANTDDQIDIAGVCLGVNSVDTGGALGTIKQTVYISKSVTFVGGWREDFSAQDEVSAFDALGLGRVVYIAPGITATLQNIDIRGGDATVAGGNAHGGGIYINQADATLQDLNIYQNNATNGGGIFITNASPVIEMGNRIFANTAVNGAAIYLNNNTGTAQIHNNFIYNNTASNDGGGFYNNSGDNLLRHNTLHNNTATNNGGGIYIATDAPQVRSSLFVSNTATTGSGAFGQTGSSPVMGYNDFFGNNTAGTAVGGNGNLAAAPGFTDISAADYTINLGSPVVNGGDPNSAILEDFEGDVRPSQQYADMGADEVGDCYAHIVGQDEIYYSAQLAIDTAQAGDTVEIDGLCMGVNRRTISTVESTQALYIDKDITLNGNWESGLTSRPETVIDAEGKGRVLYVAPGVTAVVINLHLVNGNADNAGFDTGLGGGVYNAGALTLSQSTILSNTGTTGAGFYQSNPGASTIARNTFANNTASGNGGAVYVVGTTDLQNNFMYNNEAANGAGVYRANGSASIWHNTIVSNTATSGLGGGIFVETTSGTVGSNIVHANTGSGIHALVSNVNIRYNNVVANSNSDYSGQAADLAGGISTEPTYLNAALSDFHLVDGSAGMDVGDPDTPVTNDYDGNIRPINLGYDIGADEVGSCLIRVVGNEVIPTQDFGVLQNAIDYAEANGLTELLVARGECSGVNNKGGHTQLGYITANLNFSGSLARPNFAPTGDYYTDEAYAPSSIFNATSAGRVLYIEAGANPTFNNIAFISGQANGENGGVIYNAGNSSFNDVAMCEGEADNGGILYNEIGASVEISGTTIRLGSCIVRVVAEQDDGMILENFLLPLLGGASATQNGGVIYNDGAMRLGGVGALDGLAQNGGGVYNNGLLDINKVYFGENQATAGDGGGLYNTTNVTNSQFTNVIFYKNYASDEGGGIYHSAGSDLILHHGTFNQNSANEGGGLFNLEPNFTINSTIFYSNTAVTGTNGALQSVDHTSDNNVGLNYNNFFNNTPQQSSIGFGSNAILDDPLLFDISYLSVDSPVIDQADPTLVSADPRFEVDHRDIPRPDGGPENEGAEVSPYRSDIGAYEYIKLYGCAITPLNPDPETVAAGSEQIYEITIGNVGNEETGYRDRFTISFESSSQGWGTLIGGDQQIVELDFNETAVFTVSVQIPPTALVGQVDTTIISCESATTDEKVESSYVTQVSETPGVIIEPDYPQITRKPGDVITYTHTVTNTGNAADTFELIANPGPNYANAVFVDDNGLPLTTVDLTFPLEPGESISFKLQVTVLDTAPQGGLATPGAVVRSTTDPDVTDAAQNLILVDFTTGTRYVAKGDTVDLHNNCTLATNPCATVQHAIAQATAGDSVHVSVGEYSDVYTATINSEVVTQTLLINKPITITGGYNSADLFTQFEPITNEVRFTGQAERRVIYVTEGITATLEGFFVSEGYDPLAGGGIYNQGANLTLKGVVLELNSATFGGGLYHDGGNLLVNSSVFVENHNISGQAGNGGGIYINSGVAMLENNNFIRNQTTYVDSILVADPPPLATAAGYGGGLYQAAGSVTLLNNIFSENEGLFNSSDNNAPTAAYYISPTAAVITRGYNIYFVNDSNLAVLATEMVTDPLFISSSDFHLQADSPAVDAGTLEVFTGFDIDGEPRKMGVVIDIGADELFQEPNFLFAPAELEATIDSGALYTYTFTLTNTGDFADSYTINRISTPNGGTGWGYEVSPTTINNLAIGGEVSVTLTITGGSPGYIDVTNLVAASAADPTLTRTVTATTRISQTAAVLFAPSRAGETTPNTPIVYTHTLTNTGNGPDTFQLSVTNQTAVWDVTTVPTTTAVLLPNESTTITVTVTPPSDALAGMVHQAEITAISVANPVVSDTVTNTTTILPVVGLIIDPTKANYTVADGQTATYTHTLTSQSNVTDTVNIAVSTGTGPAWMVSTSTPSVELAPFGTAVISVSVDVPPGSIGLTHTMNVTATSTLSPSVQATAVNTTTVQSVRSVTLVPDRASSTTAGQTVVYAHTLTNSGNEADSFTLNATSSQGWTVSIDPVNSGSLAANQSIPVTLSLTVPAGAAVGTVDITNLTATSTSAVTVTATVTDTTTVISETTPATGVIIAPDNATTTLAGQTIFYYHTVTNTGDIPATFSLEAVSSEDWTVTLDITSLSLDPNEAAQVEVSLTIPAAATVGTVDTTVVTATNTADTTIFDTATNTTTITDTAVAQLALQPAANAQDGIPGQLLTYSHTLINQGNQADTITLIVASSRGWPVTVDPTNVTLGAGQQTAVTTTIRIPANAAVGTSDRMTVIANSGNDGTKRATAVNTTTVVEVPASFIYLPIIVRPQSSGNPTPTPTPVTPTPTATPGTHVPTCIQPVYGQVTGVDLVVMSAQLSPSNPAVGQVVNVQVTIRNQGNTAVTFGNNFYLDAYFNNVPDPQEPGVVFWGIQGSDLGAGETRTYTAQTSFSQAGSYWIYTQVDTDGSVAETNESNNRLGGCAAHAFTVTGTSLDTDESAATPVPNAPRHTPTPVIIDTALPSTPEALTPESNAEFVVATPTPSND